MNDATAVRIPGPKKRRAVAGAPVMLLASLLALAWVAALFHLAVRLTALSSRGGLSHCPPPRLPGEGRRTERGRQ